MLLRVGYNCSEAIVEAFRKYAGVNIDDNAFRLASGFGGGIGPVSYTHLPPQP